MDQGAYSPIISGEVRWSDNGQFCYFHPTLLPIDFEIDEAMHRRIDSAMVTLGRLDGKVSQMSEGERGILTLAFTMKESALSSAIEGTGTTMTDLYRSSKVAEKDPVKAADNLEVNNYRRALDLGLSFVESRGDITEDHMLRMHDILMEGVRGRDKQPGRYRDDQVMVGSYGDTLETARFVPVPPAQVPWLMDNWFSYVNDDAGNALVKTALAHYQFETIHPFRDGNGRVGRLMIMLMLHREGIFSYPVLYISEFFNRNRTEYIDRLSGVREKDAFSEWLDFFIKGLTTQAQSSISLIDRLAQYRKDLIAGERNINTAKTIDLLFRNPFVRIGDISEELKISVPAATRMIESLEERGIIRETTGQHRNRLYVADKILEMLED